MTPRLLNNIFITISCLQHACVYIRAIWCIHACNKCIHMHHVCKHASIHFRMHRKCIHACMHTSYFFNPCIILSTKSKVHRAGARTVSYSELFIHNHQLVPIKFCTHLMTRAASTKHRKARIPFLSATQFLHSCRRKNLLSIGWNWSWIHMRGGDLSSEVGDLTANLNFKTFRVYNWASR